MNERNSIILPVDCRISASRAQYDALRSAFSGNPDITIDASQVQQVDITCLQLLASARKTAHARQKHLQITAISQPLNDALARAGLQLSSINP
ncbi:STAS domain-containing protein [Bosea sp. BK604]|uniref:STAS domain-containing protein n=1 Tax=Bosea sp. BK604 TaxID=2512180 RepID=UPI001051E298|nr:STAS domain-containing protein [Bosea sp. BK604]TCR67558.1 anti-anti-sigma regulatory factor [Bosea sp. BK604]